MKYFSDYFKNKEDRNDFYIAVGVIVLFLGSGFIYSFNWFNIQNTMSIPEKQNIMIEVDYPYERLGFRFENEVDEKFTTAILNNKKIQKIDEWIAITSIKDTIHLDSMVGVVSAEKTIDTDTVQDVPKDNTEIMVDTNQTDEVKLVDTIELSKNTSPIDSLSEQEVTTDKKTKPKKPKDKSTSRGNCIVIVGAFSVGANADNLKNELLRRGFSVYTFFRKGNKVVGIREDCNNTKELNTTLKDIQTNYNPNAWILKK